MAEIVFAEVPGFNTSSAKFDTNIVIEVYELRFERCGLGLSA